MSEDLKLLEDALKENLAKIKELKAQLRFKKLLPVLEELKLNVNSLAILDEAVKQIVLTAPMPTDIKRIAQELITGEISKGTLALNTLPRLIVSPESIANLASPSVSNVVLPQQVQGISGISGTVSQIPILGEGNNNTLSDTVKKVLADSNVPQDIKTNINTSVDILKTNLTTEYLFDNTRAVQLSKQSQELGNQADNIDKQAGALQTQIDRLQNIIDARSSGIVSPEISKENEVTLSQIDALKREQNTLLNNAIQLRSQQNQIAQQVVREFGSTPNAFLSLNITGLGKAIANEAHRVGIPIGDYINTIRRKAEVLGRPLLPSEINTPTEALEAIEPYNRLAVAINKENPNVIATATDRGVVVVPTAIFSIPHIDTAKIIAQTAPII